MDARLRDPTTPYEEPGGAAFEATLLGGELQVSEALQAHPLGATLRSGALRREAHAAPSSRADAEDPIAALPHITIAPAGDAEEVDGAAARDHLAELRIVRLLGSGGMGQVHLAEQRSLRREVAIKSTRPERASDRGRRSLLYEAVITGALEHPNIIPVHMLGRDDEGAPVMVMKKVEGVAWRELIEDEAHPWWRKLQREGGDRVDFHLDALRQVCHALEFAHQAGVIHRDVKPENVMLGAFGEVYLLDWGLATRLGAGGRAPEAKDVVGTPGFMAPEQVLAAAGAQGAHTDVYQLGATLHNALAGRHRHVGANLQQALFASLTSAPVAYPATVSADLAALCNRATAARPEDRPSGVRAFRYALEDCVAHRGSMALCRAARASLAAVRDALHPPGAGPVDRDAAVRASAACRFGFAQSLPGWAHNEDARAGLQEVADLLFDDELSRDNFEGAETAAAEMPRRTPAHDARLDALRARRGAEARRVASLQAAAQQTDQRVSSGQRTRTLLATGAFLAGFNALAAYGLWRGTQPDHAALVEFGAAGVAVAALVGWRARATLLRTAYNRAASLTAAAAVCAVFVHRVAATARDVPVPWVVTVDQLLLGCVSALGAAIVVTWLTGAAVVFGVSTVLSVLFPAHAPAPALFVLGSTVSLTVCVVLARRHGAIDLTPARPHDAP